MVLGSLRWCKAGKDGAEAEWSAAVVEALVENIEWCFYMDIIPQVPNQEGELRLPGGPVNEPAGNGGATARLWPRATGALGTTWHRPPRLGGSENDPNPYPG